MPEQSIYYEYRPQTSEDCLYLNVWTPTTALEDKASALPVMVWIHGGSLINGGSSAYDGAELARKNVVVVTINYRLNIFGYFAHPELTKESANATSGNQGTTDQIQALKWVQQNIGAFGGDPDNITIFGQSAGALSVEQLLVSPPAKGLFHKAIMQSPYFLPSVPTLVAAEKAGVGLAENIQPTLSNLAWLRALPAEKLLEHALVNHFHTEMVIDNWIMPAPIVNCFEQGLQQELPVLLGFNSGEAYGFTGSEGMLASEPGSPEQYVKDVIARYGDLADDYLKCYPPEDLREAVFAPVRDGIHGWASEKIARAIAEKSNTYLYYFDHVPSWAENARLGAFHGAEIPYVFNNVKNHNLMAGPNWPAFLPNEADITLADIISGYWVAFARSGTPAVQGRRVWQAYTDNAHHYMKFTAGAAQPDRNLLPGTFELHEKIEEKYRKHGDQRRTLGDVGLQAPIIKELDNATSKK